MKPVILLASALLLSGSVSYAVARFCACAPVASAAPASASADEISRIARALSEAEARENSLAEEVRKMRSEIAVRSSGESRIPQGEIEAAVARAIGRQEEAGMAEASSASLAAKSETNPFDARAALEGLLAKGLSREEKQEKWKAIAAAGALDDVVAMFEQYAKDHPEVALAQVELGGAYLQKVFKAGNGPEAGVWATKADKAFDSALTIDDHCWDARFSKAVSLSFWPPVFGKQNEAIKHFEVLTEQQASQSSEPKYAQTWLLLGNMYQQTGRSEQALATWKKGLELFPGNEALQEQIANAQR